MTLPSDARSMVPAPAPVIVGGAVSAGVAARLLVLLDGSSRDPEVFGIATSLARSLGAYVEILLVMKPEAHDGTASDDDATSHLGGFPATPTHVVRAGRGQSAVRTILDIACAVTPTVLCLATRRGRWPERRSLSSELLANSEIEVIAVGPGVVDPWPGLGPVVACVNGTGRSHSVLAAAGRWATALGVPVLLVTVVEPAPPPLRLRRGGAESQVDRTEDPDRYLEDLAAALLPTRVDVSWQVIYGPIGPSDGLRTFFAGHPGALGVLGGHGAHPNSDRGLGRVAARVLRTSPVPFLVS